MPITIQELLASDTISQAVDKINFNFDQLILNGGGPVGPAGPTGPTGPGGGRGPRGSAWFEDPATSPGTDPNTLIFATVLEGDNYLQANGQVWEYNGTVWVTTTINLTGPQGTPGSSIGFTYAGGFPGGTASINNQNVAYIVPMPGGSSSGGNSATNEGVSVAMFGAVASNASVPSGLSPYTSAFQISNAMVGQLDSSLLSVLIHQKDSSSSAIKFMGGGVSAADKYEQSNLGNLSGITLGVDDALNFDVPKPATSPTTLSDLIGMNFNTYQRAQQFYSGKFIKFISGTDTSSSGLASEISDISFVVGTSNATNPGKFSISTTLTSANTLMEIGGNITFPTNPTRTGNFVLDVAEGQLWGSNISLRSGVNTYVGVTTGGVNIASSAGPVLIATTAGQNVNVSSDNNVNILGGGVISLNGIGSILLNSTDIGIAKTLTHAINVDNSSSTTGSVRLKGNVTWRASTLTGGTFTNSYRNISIDKGTATYTQSPVNIGTTSLSGSGVDHTMLTTFRGNFGSSPEYVKINTSSVQVFNNSSLAGFVGFKVSNTDPSIPTANVGYQLVGKDPVTGNVGTKFHAKQETTSVYNRMQYVKKTLNINPCEAGITGGSAGTGYTIPTSSMDCSYLDILISNNGLSGPTPVVSDDEWDLFIPNGLYTGQRLNIHIKAAPGRLYDGGYYAWPAGAAGGTITVKMRRGSYGYLPTTGTTGFGVIGEISVSQATANPKLGGEMFVELLWIGQTDTSQYATGPGTYTTYRRWTGWVITNGARVSNSVNGEYEAVQNTQTWT